MADQPLKKGEPGSPEFSNDYSEGQFKSMLGGTKLASALAAEGTLRRAAAKEDLVVAEVAEPSELGFWRLSAMRFLHHRAATASLVILIFIIVTAVIIPIFQGDLYRIQDYTHPYGPPLQFHSRVISLAGLSVTIPWSDHLLGTDGLGSDEMARLDTRRTRLPDRRPAGHAGLHHHRRLVRSPCGVLRRLDRQRIDATHRT